MTLDEPPPWLDCRSGECRHVIQGQLFRSDASHPSFNSSAIELQLHRIPGLSRRFLYLNDDMFFGRPVERRAFFERDGRETVLLEPSGPSGHDVIARANEFTRRLITERDGTRPQGRQAHAPQLLNRDRLALLETIWPEAHRRTSAMTFRTSEDLMMRIAYQTAAARQLGDLLPARMRTLAYGAEYQWVMFVPDVRQSLPALAHVVATRPRFFCINDDLGDGVLADRLGRELRRHLEQMFPTPSRFERGASTSTRP